MAENSDAGKMNKFLFYLLIFIGVFAIFNFIIFRGSNVSSSPSVNANAVRSIGDWRCALSPDWCSCKPSSWCVGDYKYAIKSSNCQIKYGYCTSGQTCSGGHCQGNSTSTCTNECSANAQECISGGNSYRVCGNYDADPCSEWSSASNCPSGQVCQINNGVVQCVGQTTKQLTVIKTGNGLGNVQSNPGGIYCGNDCTEIYSPNTPVTLFANPVSPSIFVGWVLTGGTGQCVAGNDPNRCLLYMFESRQVFANFTLPNLPDLIVQSSGFYNNATNTNVYVNIKNNGTLNAGASTTRFFVTTNNVPSIYRPTSSIGAGGIVQVNATFPLLSPGSYVYVNVDIYNNVTEIYEDNNGGFVSI